MSDYRVVRVPDRVWSGLALIIGSLSVAATASPADLPFTEEAVARGVNYISNESGAGFGQGIAFVDLNNNGHPDIVAVGASNGLVGIFENDGTGHFIDRSATSGISLLLGARGICAADYDNDGYLDIYITRKQSSNVLLRNNGDFTFDDVSILAGVEGSHSSWDKGCSWGDYDDDGFVDLAIANYVGVNTLLKNQGDGTFVNVTDAAGMNTGSDKSFQVSFFDYNLDSLPDVYVIHDAEAARSGSKNSLLKNQGGSFDNVSSESGADIEIASMCIAIGDVSGNGWPDIFVTNLVWGHALLCSQSDETFTRCDVDAGVMDQGTVGWGSVFVDYNNDGLLDLYVCLSGMNRLFRGTSVWPMVEVGAAMGVNADGPSFAVAAADVNGDGAIDLLVQTRGASLKLYMNNNADLKNWAKFEIRGEGTQHHSVGARIDLRTEATWQQRQVLAGSNYLTQDHLVQHFGLNTTDVIDEIVVTWPGGHTRTLHNLSVNKTWTVYPEDKLGDGTFDGHVTFDDFLIFADCFSLSQSDGAISPGCEMMDFNGDGLVDLADFDLFVEVYEDPLDDCNNNGIPDLREILQDPSLDQEGDWSIDQCESSLPGDLNGDGVVDVLDLLLVISNWGSCGECPPACAGDANNDCQVNVQDLLIVIANWGASS